MRSRLLRNAERSKVLVTLKSGESFLGVLFDHDSKAMTLRNCEAPAANVKVDGEILILLADVAYMQRP